MVCAQPPYSSIDELSRDTGIGKDSLRVWERRYGFPSPARDDRGQRLYPPDQVERLRTIARLLDQGHRPGTIVPLRPEELQALSELNAPPANDAVEQLISAARQGDAQRLQQNLKDMMHQQGALQFILDTAAPLLEQTGRAWANGQLSIYMEHLITEHLGRTLHQARDSLAPPGQGTRVLLTTLPGERHGMGLMMVELLLRREGAETINLGVEMPVDQLVQACSDLKPQILALSFSAVQKRAGTLAGLRELSEKLPEDVSLLVGGEGVSRLRQIPERVQVLSDLERVGPTLAALQRQREAAL